MRLNVSVNALCAAYTMRSTDQTRYYLDGVFVTRHPVDGVLLVATDGHRMAVVHDACGHTDRDVILSGDFTLKGAFKPERREVGHRRIEVELPEKTSSKPLPATVLSHCPHGESTGSEAGFVTLHEVDGTYPMWHRVIPWGSIGKGPGAPFGFKAEYIAAFIKMFDLLGAHNTHVTFEQEDPGAPIRVTCNSVANAFGILMPCRIDDRPPCPFVDQLKPPPAPRESRNAA